MCKTFLCLNGLNNFLENDLSAVDLLQAQVVEFLFRRGLHDGKQLVRDVLELTPRLIDKTLNEGHLSIVTELAASDVFINDLRVALKDMKETLKLIELSRIEKNKEQQEETPNGQGRRRKIGNQNRY